MSTLWSRIASHILPWPLCFRSPWLYSVNSYASVFSCSVWKAREADRQHKKSIFLDSRLTCSVHFSAVWPSACHWLFLSFLLLSPLSHIWLFPSMDYILWILCLWFLEKFLRQSSNTCLISEILHRDRTCISMSRHCRQVLTHSLSLKALSELQVLLS